MTHQASIQTSETQARDLTPDELRHVSGGGEAAHSGGVNVLMADGSVRCVDAADYALWRANYGSKL